MGAGSGPRSGMCMPAPPCGGGPECSSCCAAAGNDKTVQTVTKTKVFFMTSNPPRSHQRSVRRMDESAPENRWQGCSLSSAGGEQLPGDFAVQLHRVIELL